MTTDIMTRPMEYTTDVGEAIKLTPAMVREYLVRGKKELVTKQEMIFFMHTCKARRLNPFIGDCYLVKYGSDPAAIITSRNYYEQTAMNHPRCKGWVNGVVVTKNGEITERDGTIVLDDEILVGGWAETAIEGWAAPKKWTVMLNGYVKKTRDGKVTKFWTKEKQPHMIAKVALVQLLREVYGAGAKNMYTPDELPAMDTEPIQMQPSTLGGGYEPTTENEAPLKKLDPVKVAESKLDELITIIKVQHGWTGSKLDVEKFVGHTADVYKESHVSIIDQALSNPSSFAVGLNRWIRPETKPSEPDLPWYDVENWKLLRAPGFKIFVNEFRERLPDIPHDVTCSYKGKKTFIREALYAKWTELYPDEKFPGLVEIAVPPQVDVEPPPQPEPPPNEEPNEEPNEPPPTMSAIKENTFLRTNFYDHWLKARTDLNFGGAVPMSEQAAEIWNAKINEFIDKNNAG